MKNTVLENLKRAAEERKEAEKKAAKEALLKKYEEMPQKGILDTIKMLDAGELIPVYDPRTEMLIGFASSAEDKEKMLNLYASMGMNMSQVYMQCNIAQQFVEAEMIPDHSFKLDNGIEILVKGKTAYDHEGKEIANCNDLKSKLSQEDLDIILKERVEQALQEEKIECSENYDEDDYDDYYIQDEDCDY